jgi:hypothetical protein
MTEITRETLELAALAAGMIPAEFAGNVNYLDGVLDRWRPHLDDGDAARLAVRLSVMMDADQSGYCHAIHGLVDTISIAHDGTEPDKLRAWREAAVLCAAAVGERMRGER